MHFYHKIICKAFTPCIKLSLILSAMLILIPDDRQFPSSWFAMFFSRVCFLCITSNDTENICRGSPISEYLIILIISVNHNSLRWYKDTTSFADTWHIADHASVEHHCFNLTWCAVDKEGVEFPNLSAKEILLMNSRYQCQVEYKKG